MKGCNRIRPGETHAIRFVIFPKHLLCAIVHGHELSLSTLGERMGRVQAESWALVEELLGGLR